MRCSVNFHVLRETSAVVSFTYYVKVGREGGGERGPVAAALVNVFQISFRQPRARRALVRAALFRFRS